MSDFTRRRLLTFGVGVGGGLVLSRFAPERTARAALPPSPLDPTAIPKYAEPLVIPPAMPRTGTLRRRGGKNLEYYEIAVRQFQQQILPTGFPLTTVWSYGSVNHPGSFNYPAFTIEATWRKPVAVKWINDLKDANGHFLPHLLAVDQTLHWANPPGGTAGRDTRPTSPDTGPYRGPVPLVTHLHGGEGTAQESDGFAEAWFLPDANDIPSGYAETGTKYDPFKASSPLGELWGRGNAVFEYANDWRPATLWYHDHTLGMTRVNVYAGPAGFYLLRGGPGDAKDHELPGPAPQLGDRPGTKYFEIPLAIQDRSFNCDGSLFYPNSRAELDGFPGPYIPDSPVPPIWGPEFFGDTMVVNGRTWPRLAVEQRRYRFRLLNGCDARFLILQFGGDLLGGGMPFWIIGTDGGFLAEPKQVTRVLLSPAQRADIIVDFTHACVGTQITLLNFGPDAPFGGGTPGVDFMPADPGTTGQVMRFDVVPATSRDKSTPPSHLRLPKFTPLGAPSTARQVSLNEELFDGVSAMLQLGTLDSNGQPVPLAWGDPPTETPTAGVTELWEIYNFTADAHPIHIHEVQFQFVNREALPPPDGTTPPPPTPQEQAGFIDTVIAYPGQITRVKVRFPTPGLFVWHCHIIEHEDNEMMRPLQVLPPV